MQMKREGIARDHPARAACGMAAGKVRKDGRASDASLPGMRRDTVHGPLKAARTRGGGSRPWLAAEQRFAAAELQSCAATRMPGYRATFTRYVCMINFERYRTATCCDTRSTRLHAMAAGHH